MPSSPSWHRKARRSRSLARARVVRATTSGTAYKGLQRDIDLLEAHHSRPVYIKARRLFQCGMGDWISPKGWWGRNSGSAGYPSYYSAKGTGKGNFADGEHNARKDRQREKKKGTQPKGAAKGSQQQQGEDKTPASSSTAVGPSYTEMLKLSKQPEAKRQQAASAIEEILAERPGEDCHKLMAHLKALLPESSTVSSAGDTSLKTKIHRVGNALGKATAKVAKHTEEIALKQRTWEKCSLAIREWAATQRKTFEQDIATAKEALETAQKEEQEAMTQLKELQERLDGKGNVEETETAPMEEMDENLFDTPPTLQQKDTGMTPQMKRLSLQLQAANVEKEELKRQNQQMMEETQKLFFQMQQQGKQPVEEVQVVGSMSAAEVQAKLDQDRARQVRQKQLERARATVIQDQLAEQKAKDDHRRDERERSPRKNGDSQGSLHSLNSLT